MKPNQKSSEIKKLPLNEKSIKLLGKIHLQKINGGLILIGTGGQTLGLIAK